MNFEYILENYLWLLIIIFIILMAIIGFIADKTHFIEQNKNKSKGKKEVSKEEPEPVVDLNNTPLYDAIRKAAGDEIISNTQQEQDNLSTEKSSMDLENSDNNDISDIPSELFAPISDSNSKVEDIIEQQNLDTLNNLESHVETTEFSESDSKNINEQNSDLDKNQESENLDTSDETEDQSEISEIIDDDVWKF